MGFHIINIVDGKLIHHFAKNEVELAMLDIKEDTIIYQGESHWIPEKVKDSKKYSSFSNGWFRAGIKAQELFKQQAKNRNLILEELFQDQESFKSYTDTAKEIQIKRGDFLIRNIMNLEIDVKYRNFYECNGQIVFNFKVHDYYKHKNMMEFTKTPIIIAVYKNINNNPDPESLRMFEIDWIKKNNFEIIEVSKAGKCFQIPVEKTYADFELIEKYREKINILQQMD